MKRQKHSPGIEKELKAHRKYIQQNRHKLTANVQLDQETIDLLKDALNVVEEFVDTDDPKWRKKFGKIEQTRQLLFKAEDNLLGQYKFGF